MCHSTFAISCRCRFQLVLTYAAVFAAKVAKLFLPLSIFFQLPRVQGFDFSQSIAIVLLPSSF